MSYDNGLTWNPFRPPIYSNGDLIENNSTDCGYCEPLYRWEKGSDSDFVCVNYSKYYQDYYQISTDCGKTWKNVEPEQKRIGDLMEQNSIDCDYGISWGIVEGEYICELSSIVYRWQANGEMCSGLGSYVREIYQISYDNGKTWKNVDPYQERAGTLIMTPSPNCNSFEFSWNRLNDEYECNGYDKYETLTYQYRQDEVSEWVNVNPLQTKMGNLLEKNSYDCGYVHQFDEITKDYSNNIIVDVTSQGFEGYGPSFMNSVNINGETYPSLLFTKSDSIDLDKYNVTIKIVSYNKSNLSIFNTFNFNSTMDYSEMFEILLYSKYNNINYVGVKKTDGKLELGKITSTTYTKIASVNDLDGLLFKNVYTYNTDGKTNVLYLDNNMLYTTDNIGIINDSGLIYFDNYGENIADIYVYKYVVNDTEENLNGKIIAKYSNQSDGFIQNIVEENCLIGNVNNGNRVYYYNLNTDKKIIFNTRLIPFEGYSSNYMYRCCTDTSTYRYFENYSETQKYVIMKENYIKK